MLFLMLVLSCCFWGIIIGWLVPGLIFVKWALIAIMITFVQWIPFFVAVYSAIRADKEKHTNDN